MINKFEHEGYWWLPENEDNKICGILKYTPGENATLELMGSFEGLQNIKKMSEIKLIHGFSSKGEEITLYRCYEKSTTISVPGFQTTLYLALMVFVGIHFEKEEDIKFKELLIHYSYLEEWINVSGIDYSRFVNNKDIDISIQFKQPEPIQAEINENYRLSIHFGYLIPKESRREIGIKERVSIGIESSKEKSFAELLVISSHIQNFISFGVMEPVYPLFINGKTELKKELIDGNTHYPLIEIYYNIPNIYKPVKSLPPFDILFTYDDISDKFDLFLQNWFEKLDKLTPVFNLYFGTRYNPNIYREHRFLSIIQAIESYHRRILGGKYLSDDDYQKIYEKMVMKIPDEVKDDHKDSLNSKLKFGNEYSLRKRLNEIFKEYNYNLQMFITNKDIFINNAVDTRNYLVHYVKNLEDNAASGNNLIRLTQKLKVLLEICLLAEIGFTPNEIRKLLIRNRKYNYLLKDKEN